MKQILKTISLSAIAIISLSTSSYATCVSNTDLNYHMENAKNGNMYSQNIIGEYYLNGDMLPRNTKKAVEWFKKAAIQGYDKAEYNLGLCYYNGWGVNKDYKQAANYFKESLNNDYISDNSDVDSVEGYIPELSVETINEESYEEEYGEEYEEEISSEAAAQYDLAQLHIEENNIKEAIKCLTLAAKEGHPYAQGQLAQLYAEVHDYENALFWYKKENDYLASNANIGDMLYSMAFYADDKNYPTFLQEAVNRGNINALPDLASLYAMGELVERDDNKAVELFSQYAQYLNTSLLDYYGVSKQDITIADVYYYIAREWFHISRGNNDIEPRMQYIKKAAEHGHALAQLNMGYEYNNGDEYCGIKQDYSEAAKWFKKAAEHGNVYAQFMLGDYYNEGKGVEKDLTQAFQWYKKAADQDLGDALYQLGEYYTNGHGVKKDKKLANEYYQKAANAFKANAEEYFENYEIVIIH